MQLAGAALAESSWEQRTGTAKAASVLRS